MVTTTLKTRVLKTALVGNVKLPTPADRIGSGLVVGTDYPRRPSCPRGSFPCPDSRNRKPGPGRRSSMRCRCPRPATRTVRPGESLAVRLVVVR